MSLGCGGATQPSGTPTTGTVGQWTNVTPAAINLTSGGDNFGVQDVFVIPRVPAICTCSSATRAFTSRPITVSRG